MLTKVYLSRPGSLLGFQEETVCLILEAFGMAIRITFSLIETKSGITSHKEKSVCSGRTKILI